MSSLIWGSPEATVFAKSMAEEIEACLRKQNRCIIAIDDGCTDTFYSTFANQLRNFDSYQREHILLIPFVKHKNNRHYLLEKILCHIKGVTQYHEGPHILGVNDHMDNYRINAPLVESFAQGMTPNITVISVRRNGGICLPAHFIKPKTPAKLIEILKFSATIRDTYDDGCELQMLSSHAIWRAKKLFLIFPFSGLEQQVAITLSLKFGSVINKIITEHPNITVVINTADPHVEQIKLKHKIESMLELNKKVEQVAC